MVIKEKLFESGHYRLEGHISARDWINLEKLFAIDSHQFVEPIIKVIEDEVLPERSEDKENMIIIGLNNFGAILASIIANKEGCPFTYYFQDKDFIDDVENEIQEIKGKKVLVITDVMVFGNTICKFMDKICEKQENIENKVDIVVLFERKTNTDFIPKVYQHTQIGKIFVLNDDFNIELCNKNRNECIFAQNDNFSKYKNIPC